ncbi:AMP-binding protein [Nocardiopsis sp. LOL_012]|uniref:AMP-binding protein n=1 Tax=Nocardiopsis sp. LOL_012 TaxID=3345409 RepID=UPI003A89DFD5
MSKDRGAEGAEEFRAARDLLLRHREDRARAHREFAWPASDRFNWALDYFDPLGETIPDRTALWIVEENGEEAKYTYRHLSERSSQVANWLIGQGVRPGDRIMLMLGNQVELWETLLAAVKLGAVVTPTPPALTDGDLADRLERGAVAHVVCTPDDTKRFEAFEGHWTRVCVGYMDGWLSYPDSEHAALDFAPPHATDPDDPLLLYFTSGTTALPKPVTHTQRSYPVGHLSTMYWLGVQPADIHLNVSPPGWAKHAYGSMFAPWNAEATVLVVNQSGLDAQLLLDEIERCGVTTMCAPPMVWRALVRTDLVSRTVRVREAVAAGEPLPPDLVDRVREAWGVTVRDGFGQTETTLLIGNAPGQPVTPGSMGLPMPGYDIELLEQGSGEPTDSGEICVDLSGAPAGMMAGYADGSDAPRKEEQGDFYRTGDIATRGPDGRLTYVGRTDDVFKASDYRVSPFEIEGTLIEHEYVSEAAVVPSPDPLRLSVAKAFVVLADGVPPDADTARTILAYAREHLSPHMRVRRLEFAELPRSSSGKISRTRLRQAEAERGTMADCARNPCEFWEEDLPGLKG